MNEQKFRKIIYNNFSLQKLTSNRNNCEINSYFFHSQNVYHLSRRGSENSLQILEYKSNIENQVKKINFDIFLKKIEFLCCESWDQA